MSVDGSRDWYILMGYETSVGALVTAFGTRAIPQKRSDPTRTHRSADALRLVLVMVISNGNE